MASSGNVRATAGAAGGQREKPSVSFTQADIPEIAQHVFALMLRNITTDGYVLNDPYSGKESKPGCIIAAPSYLGHTPNTDQDYVYNWVRDAAITAMEIAFANKPAEVISGAQTLIDYVIFAQTCQQAASPTLGHACFTVDGKPRPWTEQSDGPALQTLAILQAYAQLDSDSQVIANEIVCKNLAYLLAEYKSPTFNLWEEHQGLSFFAQSVQLRCFQAVATNTVGITIPDGITDAITWLQGAVDAHWNGSSYISLLAPPSPGNANNPLLPDSAGYDPNIDIVCASIYGAIPCTDTKLLATAAKLRAQWADANSGSVYPINLADAKRGIGPMLGRYPGDQYDGDVAQPERGDHPWPVCTCNFAELYYTLANSIEARHCAPQAMPCYGRLSITVTTLS